MRRIFEIREGSDNYSSGRVERTEGNGSIVRVISGKGRKDRVGSKEGGQRTEGN